MIPKDSTVYLDKYTNIEIYDRNNNVGLNIIRPNKKEIMLNKLPKNNVTVFHPYIKNSKPQDTPQAVSNEYLYSKEQTVKITR